MVYISINAADGKLWGLLPEPFRLLFLLVLFFIELLVLAVFLHFAGLMVVGGRRARFSDALVISLLGNVLAMLFFAFIPYYLIASFLSIVTWLLLIKNLYETGWLGAIAVGILAIFIYLVIIILLLFVFGIIKEIGEFFFYILFFLSRCV
jgi:hypothetical protein